MIGESKLLVAVAFFRALRRAHRRGCSPTSLSGLASRIGSGKPSCTAPVTAHRRDDVDLGRVSSFSPCPSRVSGARARLPALLVAVMCLAVHHDARVGAGHLNQAASNRGYQGPQRYTDSSSASVRCCCRADWRHRRRSDGAPRGKSARASSRASYAAADVGRCARSVGGQPRAIGHASHRGCARAHGRAKDTAPVEVEDGRCGRPRATSPGCAFIAGLGSPSATKIR